MIDWSNTRPPLPSSPWEILHSQIEMPRMIEEYTGAQPTHFKGERGEGLDPPRIGNFAKREEFRTIRIEELEPSRQTGSLSVRGLNLSQRCARDAPGMANPMKAPGEKEVGTPGLDACAGVWRTAGRSSPRPGPAGSPPPPVPPSMFQGSRPSGKPPCAQPPPHANDRMRMCDGTGYGGGTHPSNAPKLPTTRPTAQFCPRPSPCLQLPIEHPLSVKSRRRRVECGGCE